MGVEAHRLLHQPQGFLWLPCEVQNMRQIGIALSIVGSEEIHPNLAEIPGMARLLGLPYMPVTPTFPWLGPAGLVPLPSSWIIEFHEPIAVAAQSADDAAEPGRVLDISDQVRDVIQAGVYRNLQRRQSVFAIS